MRIRGWEPESITTAFFRIFVRSNLSCSDAHAPATKISIGEATSGHPGTDRTTSDCSVSDNLPSFYLAVLRQILITPDQKKKIKTPHLETSSMGMTEAVKTEISW